jgi:hypothetical protein
MSSCADAANRIHRFKYNGLSGNFDDRDWKRDVDFVPSVLKITR